MTFSRVSIIVAMTAVLVYFGLNLLLPRNQKEKAATSGVTADQVFSGAPAPADSATPAQTGDGAAALEPSLPAAESAAAPAESADSQGLSDEEARKIAENVSREVANRVVESSDAGTAPAPAETAPASASAPEPEPPAPASSSADAASPVATESPKPVVAASVSKPAKPKARRTAKGSSSPGSDVISSWWPATDKQTADKLNVVYAGEAATEKSVVLMFSSAMGDPAAAGRNIQLLSARGGAVNGAWTAGNNPRLLVFKGVKPGRYTVILKPELADAGGKALGSELHGPVYVH